METSSITYGRTHIAYRIQRSLRRKTVAVTVAATDGVVLVAPAGVPVPRLDQVVRQKAPWIVDRLRRTAEVEPSAAPRQFVSGETFLYLGRSYRLKVVPSRHPEPTKLHHGWLHVPVDRSLPLDARPAAVRSSLEAWYRARARTRIPERVEAMSRRFNLTPTSVIIRDQTKRWGSCDSRGRIRLNWRILQAPSQIVDYVVAHEIAHLQFRSHSRCFWKFLQTHLPDAHARRSELRILGPHLTW